MCSVQAGEAGWSRGGDIAEVTQVGVDGGGAMAHRFWDSGIPRPRAQPELTRLQDPVGSWGHLPLLEWGSEPLCPGSTGPSDGPVDR